MRWGSICAHGINHSFDFIVTEIGRRAKRFPRGGRIGNRRNNPYQEWTVV